MLLIYSLVIVLSTTFIDLHGATIGTKKIKENLYDPILSSTNYIGRLKENERQVQLTPTLEATDADLVDTPNNQICGYQISQYKHDDQLDQTDERIPFLVKLIDGQAVIELKSSVKQLDCEWKQTYHLFIRAYDCNGRYSERSSLLITIDDVNEFLPVFTHENYLFKLHQDQTCSSCRVEATDDDCSNVNHRVCDYRILTANVPFAIDSNGSISIIETLSKEIYQFDVVAVDCDQSDTLEKISQPAQVTVKLIQSCKPTITDNNPTKLTIQSDHTHIFDGIHVNTCDDTCVVEEIVGQIDLQTDGIDSGCHIEQCAPTTKQYQLIGNDQDTTDQLPPTHPMLFEDETQAFLVPNANFSGKFKSDFIIRLKMKHAADDADEKEHIFCQSDEKLKNRHHRALFVHNDQLKLLIRKGPIESSEKTRYASEWTWTLPQINDDQWHSYKFFINYPDRIDLYVDDQLFSSSDSNHQIIEDHALATIEGTGNLVVAVGACWHGRVSRLVQPFRGQIAALSIEQKEESKEQCVRDCQEFLDLPDVQTQSNLEYSTNVNRSAWIVRTDSSESYEDLLKHLIYRNILEPIGPSGPRTVSIQTTVKCYGENFTYNLPAFTRRLSIDEPIHPVQIELKGDRTMKVTEAELNRGISLFDSVSIYTDALNKNQADITDCSISTQPEFSRNERLFASDENFGINNLDKVPTQTGFMLSGSGSIDSYQNILRHISYVAQSPIEHFERTFSLICMGAHDQSSTNEVRIEIHVEKHIVPAAPVAAILSDKLVIDNDFIRDNIYDVDGFSSSKNLSGWPLVVVVCASVGLASVLVLYLVVRLRSGQRHRRSTTGAGDDVHSQMEWEDDIGLNITVNPLDETKKSTTPTVKMHQLEQTLHDYDGASSEEDEYEEHHYGEYSSEGEDEVAEEEEEENEDEEEDDEEEENDEDDHYRRIHPRQVEHQLEWDDDVAMGYGPKKV